MKELMNKGRKMYESYWAFETGKWTKINYISRQVVMKNSWFCDMYAKEALFWERFLSAFNNDLFYVSAV